MKVGIDARLVTYRRGIGNIVYNLLTALAEQSSSVEFYLYVDNPQAAQYVPVNPRFKLKLLYPNLYPVWEQVLLPLQVKRDELDVLYCPANTAPLGLSKSTRLVLTIADVMYMLPSSVMPVSPSLYQRVGRQYLKNIVPHVVHQAAAVTTISNYSKADIVKHLHLDPASIYVVPPAPGSAFNKLNNSSLLYATKVKFGITERMVLALGAMDPRKNTARVIESFANYIAQFKSSMQLVVAGLSSNGREYFTRFARRLGIDKKVILLSYVTENELVELYNAAEVFLYPSLYEGFGLPVLEAMACGTPVITSGITSIPEVAGSAAIFIDPTNIQALTQAMDQILNDETFRNNLIQCGHHQVAKFSWTMVAQEMSAIYEIVAKQ